MRVLALSDLHLNVWHDDAPRFDQAISRPDVVTLADDNHAGAKVVPWASAAFPGVPVLVISGNHETYNATLDKVRDQMREACAAHPNVHYLDCDQLVFGAARFLGCTLWSDMALFGNDSRPAAMLDAMETMHDYRSIRVPQPGAQRVGSASEAGYRRLRPSDTAALHARHRRWLEERLDEPFAGKTFVLTHHAPSMRSVDERYATDVGSACYASNLDRLVEKADYWQHGHMHKSRRYAIGKGTVICNPLGYMNKSGGPENTDFNPNLIIDI